MLVVANPNGSSNSPVATCTSRARCRSEGLNGCKLDGFVDGSHEVLMVDAFDTSDLI